MTFVGALLGALSFFSPLGAADEMPGQLTPASDEGTAQPVVDVDVAPELSGGNFEALLKSCTSVFASRSAAACRATGEGLVQARVSWKINTSGLQVTIEVLRRATRTRTMRVLSFSDTEKDGARWQAVGLVVAALASAEQATPEVKSEPVVLPRPLPPRPLPPKLRLVMEIAGLVRQEAAAGFLSGGGTMRASVQGASRWEPTFALAALAGTAPVNQVTLRPSFGVGYRAVEGPVTLALRVERACLCNEMVSVRSPFSRQR